jgi:hypothetical protein
MAWLRLEGMLYVVIVGQALNEGLGRIGYEI